LRAHTLSLTIPFLVCISILILIRFQALETTNKHNPEFSVIIPARNEEEMLPRCLKHIQLAAQVANTSPEIVVVLNRCDDQTEAIAKSFGCLCISNEAKNLSILRNSGVEASSGKIVMTIDADSFVSSNIFIEARTLLEKRNYVAGGVWILPERWSLGIAVSFFGLLPFLLYWRVSCGVFYCYRATFDAVGGFNPNFFSAEDVDFAKRLRAFGKARGQKFRMFSRAYITTSCRKFDRFGDWYFIKNIFKMLKLLKGQRSQDADQLWYDFKR
jgi:glycosyltransferase involved in cell wall biosynthesis